MDMLSVNCPVCSFVMVSCNILSTHGRFLLWGGPHTITAVRYGHYVEYRDSSLLRRPVSMLSCNYNLLSQGDVRVSNLPVTLSPVAAYQRGFENRITKCLYTDMKAERVSGNV